MKLIQRTSSRLVAVLIATMSVVGAAEAQTAVRVGGEADYDACSGFGVVKGLNPRGDGFLAVRSGPGSRNPRLDKIHNGQQVWFCDQKGVWIGIVYSRQQGVDCRVSSPIAKRSPYAGPCKSGWVHQKYVKQTAG